MKYSSFTSCVVVLLLLFCSCGGKERPATALMEKSDTVGRSGADTLQVTKASFTFSYTQEKGGRLFDRYCVICHGQHGEGDGFNAYNLDPKPHSLADSAYVAAFSDEALSQVIALGGRGVNKSVLMPAYGWTLTKDQISYLVSYLRTLAHNESVGQ
jgi:mono/diheme cytochrome c family protein